MKPFPRVLLALIASSIPTFSQDSPPVLARSFVPDALLVPAFTPPAPVEPKCLPIIRIDAAATLPSHSGKTITLQRGAASTLPDLPPPPPEPVKQARVLTPTELARIAYKQRHTFNVGASVFDHKVSIVNWTDPENGSFYEAVCGFDIGLLAGIGRIVHAGEEYSIHLIHSNFDTTRDSRIARPKEATQIDPGQILITKGDSKNTTATVQLAIIRDLITAEKERLLAYQAARLQHQQAAAAWEGEHPPIPRDETVVLRPHRGSRYLADPQPEKKGEATR